MTVLNFYGYYQVGEGMKNKLILACSVCGLRNYTVPSTQHKSDRLELKKYCKNCNAHTNHRQTK